jgi:MFS family permease
MLKKFLPIILLTFVNVIGFSLLIPVLPSVVEGYVGSERLQGVIYGALIASYSLCQFLAAPALGTLSDKYGRKPVLMLSQLGTTLSWVIFGAAYFIPETRVFGLALPIFIISLSRITDGLTGGNISVAQAWISDMTTKEEKTKTFASIGAVFGIGFLIGPAIGGLAASTSYGYLGTAVVAFIISLFTLIYMQLYLPESLPEDKRDHELRFHLGRELNVIGKLQEFRDNRVVKSLLFIRIFFAIVFASYTTIVTLYLSNRFRSDVQLDRYLFNHKPDRRDQTSR